MAATEWYKDWFNSPYYHKLYFERDDIEAKSFIKRLLVHLNPSPGSRMLDIACGKGRHSKFLAEQNYDVAGIDISIDSINYAKQFEVENLHFYLHDMRLLFWVNYFDYAFNFFTSFGYFNTQREHNDAMRTIAASLRPGGILVIDYLNVHYAEDHLKRDEIKQQDGATYTIQRWQDEHHFYKKIIVTDEALQQPVIHTERVAKFSLHNFTDMLSLQKLQISQVFGNYELNGYDAIKTPRMIIIAKKN
ncbi:MAG: class I SAM-dependent methyltransferase [Chitinophagaceae bacterium]